MSTLTPVSINSYPVTSFPQTIECSQKIEDGIKKYFHGITPQYLFLKGGNVGKVYLLFDPIDKNKKLVLKIFGEQKKTWPREIAMCQWSGKHGIGPYAHACDEESGQILMEHIKGGPLN